MHLCASLCTSVHSSAHCHKHHTLCNVMCVHVRIHAYMCLYVHVCAFWFICTLCCILLRAAHSVLMSCAVQCCLCSCRNWHCDTECSLPLTGAYFKTYKRGKWQEGMQENGVSRVPDSQCTMPGLQAPTINSKHSFS